MSSYTADLQETIDSEVEKWVAHIHNQVHFGRRKRAGKCSARHVRYHCLDLELLLLLVHNQDPRNQKIHLLRLLSLT